MDMRMVVIIGRGHLASFIGVRKRYVVGVVAAVLVTVVTEWAGITLCMLQCVTNRHDRRVGGVQRKQGSEQDGQEKTHGPDYITWVERRRAASADSCSSVG